MTACRPDLLRRCLAREKISRWSSASLLSTSLSSVALPPSQARAPHFLARSARSRSRLGRENTNAKLARRQRIHDVASAAYADYLYYVYGLQRLVLTTTPRPHAEVRNVPPNMREALDDPKVVEGYQRAAARTAIIASEGVAKAMNEVDQRFYDFVHRLGYVEGYPTRTGPRQT